MSKRNSRGVVKSNNREFAISRIDILAKLRPEWVSKISPSSLCWEVDIWVTNQDLVCDVPGSPAIELLFRRQEFGTVRNVDATSYDTDNSLFGVVHIEYSQIKKASLYLSWREDNSLNVEGEVETARASYYYQGIGDFTGIHVQDTGSMDVAETLELLKRAIRMDELELNGIRKSCQLPDGRDYTEILFVPTWQFGRCQRL